MPSSDDNQPPQAFIPIPEQIQREIAVCKALDALDPVLNEVRDARLGTAPHSGLLPASATKADYVNAWVKDIMQIQALLERVDNQGRALVKAVKAMLAIE